MRLIFVGQGYPLKLFNLEHFLIYGILICNYASLQLATHSSIVGLHT